jgi:beta-lactam-binding protein with PASTA domain
VSIIKKSASAFGKLIVVLTLAATFNVGLLTVVFLRLQGEEMKVPEIVGKDFVESERELAELGLRIKKRADRPSTEKQNTVIEQLPKAGDTVKTGQMILVVTSKGGVEAGETPVTLKKNTNEEDESEKIEELISDKPKKSNKTNQSSSSNKKKTSTTRDVLSNNSNSNSNSSDSNNSNKKGSESNSNSADKGNKNTPTVPGNKTPAPADAKKTENPKPATGKTTGAEARPRKTPNR